MADEVTAFDLGYQSFIDGVGNIWNPYEPTTFEHAEWKRGWDAAFQEEG